MKRAKRRGKKTARRKPAARKAARRRPARKTASRKSARKKSTRKSAGRGKAARSRTTARRSASGGGRARTKVVVLDPDKKPKNKKTHLSKKRNEGIAWKNRDTVDHVIEFTSPTWPFLGSRRTVRAYVGGALSERLEIDPSMPTGTSYDYKITPALPNWGPPDGPSVITDE